MHTTARSIAVSIVAAVTLLGTAGCGGSAEADGDDAPPAATDLSIEQVRGRLGRLAELDCGGVVPYEDVPAGLTGNEPSATLECTRADSLVHVAAYDTPELLLDNLEQVRSLESASPECDSLRGLSYLRGRSWMAFATDADDETDAGLLDEVAEVLGVAPEAVDC